MIIIGGYRNSRRTTDKIQSTSPRTEFRNWFKGSVVVDDNNKPLVVYHGSTEDIKQFDVSRINPYETDANYNGFWFTSSERNASPAWTDAKYVKGYYLALKNPAPIDVANEVHKELSHLEVDPYPNSKSYADSTRLRLQEMGYDGVVHQDAPKIDWKEFDRKGEYTYTSNRGTQYQIVNNTEYGGIDLNYARNGENITGYSSKEDFIRMNSEKVYVMFDPKSIREVIK